jgi:hypothetical protein
MKILYNRECGYEVLGISLLRDLKEATQFDPNKDMSVNVSTWIDYDLNALTHSYIEVVALIKCLCFYVSLRK